MRWRRRWHRRQSRHWLLWGLDWAGRWMTFDARTVLDVTAPYAAEWLSDWRRRHRGPDSNPHKERDGGR